jgi:putative monooxygenase
VSAPVRVVKLAEITPNRRRGGDIRITLGPATVGATSGFGGILELQCGERVNEHYHPYSEEFLHVISGHGDFEVDGVHLAVGPGESVLVPIGVRHRLVNNGTEPVRAVFHLSPLAPLPALGHVDLEEPADPQAPHPQVGDRP